MNKPITFVFTSVSNRVNLNTANGDSSVVLKVDRERKSELAPFLAIDENAQLLITVEVVE